MNARQQEFAAARADLFRRIAAGCDAGLNPPMRTADHHTDHDGGSYHLHAWLVVEAQPDVMAWAAHLGQPVADTYPYAEITEPVVATHLGRRHHFARVNLSDVRWVQISYSEDIAEDGGDPR